MTRALNLLVVLALCLGTAACGEDKQDPKPTPDGGKLDSSVDGDVPDDANVPADGSIPTDGNVPDADSAVDETGFNSGLDPNVELGDLTEEQGKTLCNNAQDYANGQLPENQRAFASCLTKQAGAQNAEECESGILECMEDPVGPAYVPLDFGCDALDVTTDCTGEASVSDLEDCASGVGAYWAFLAPISSCQAFLDLEPADLEAGLAALNQFRAGLAHCATAAAACPGAITVPDVNVNP